MTAPLYHEPGLFDAAILVGFAALYLAVEASDRLDLPALLERGGDVDREDRVEDLRERYVAGELGLREFEARVAIVLDADARRLRERLERVDGVGPETSAALASRFETVEAVREADRSDLTAVDGVGPSRADAIRELF